MYALFEGGHSTLAYLDVWSVAEGDHLWYVEQGRAASGSDENVSHKWEGVCIEATRKEWSHWQSHRDGVDGDAFLGGDLGGSADGHIATGVVSVCKKDDNFVLLVARFE